MFSFHIIAAFTILCVFLPFTLAQACTLTIPNFATIKFFYPIAADHKKELTAIDFTYHSTASIPAGSKTAMNLRWMAVFTCQPSFTLIGASHLICMPAADQNQAPQLNGNVPECIKSACLMLDPHDKIEFRYKAQKLASNSGGFPVGTEMIGSHTFNCPSGYKFGSISNSEKSFCQENGIWSTPLTPKCVAETDSCSWDDKTDKNVKFRLKNKPIIESYVLKYLPDGGEIIDYQTVACPPGFIFKGNSVKVCHKGTWILSEQPCIPSWNVTISDTTDIYSSEQKNSAAECNASSNYVLVVWAVAMTLLCAALIAFILKPWNSLRTRFQKARSKRSSGSCIDRNEKSELRRQRVSIVHLPNHTNSEDIYSTISDDKCLEESIYSDVTTKSPCSSPIGGLKAEPSSLETDQTPAEESSTYSGVVQKSKR